jgi:phage gpG-like protein
MADFRITIEVEKRQYRRVLKIFDKIQRGMRWKPDRSNPFQRVQRYMYASTMGKFAAEGISPDGSKRWWRKWASNYREWRVRVMKQPRPILRLDGTYTSKGGKTYTYNLKLIKSIRKAAPNRQGILLTTNAIHAATHQYGDIRAASGAGRGSIGGKKKKMGLFGSVSKWFEGTALGRILSGKGKTRSRRRGKFRNIPARPFFLFTVLDNRIITGIFDQFFVAEFQKRGISASSGPV